MTKGRADLLAAVVLAAALAAGLTGHLDAAAMVAGVFALGVAVRMWDRRPLLGGLTGMLGGWLIVRFAIADEYAGWPGAAGVLGALAVVASMGTWRRLYVSVRVAPACLALSCAGVWACVPETTGPGRLCFVVGAAGAVAAVVGWPVSVEALAAAAGLVLAAGLLGGQYRASAIVGTVGILGLFGVACAVRFVPRIALRAGRWRDVLVVCGHALNALVASRVAGRGGGGTYPPAQSVVIAGLSLALLVVWTAALTRGQAESQ